MPPSRTTKGSYRQNLTRIRESSEQLRQQIRTLIPSGSVPRRATSPSHIIPKTWNFDSIFPTPSMELIMKELQDNGWNRAVVPVSAAYLKAASRLSEHYKVSLRKNFESLDSTLYPPEFSNKFYERWKALYSKKYHSHLSQMMQRILCRVHPNLEQDHVPISKQVKQKDAFHPTNVHILEQYFEQNRYPSTADRAYLAQKSGLTLRQTEVWFQNHRTRAKKAGQVVERLGNNDVPYDFFQKLSPTMKGQDRKTHEGPPSVFPSPPSSPNSDSQILQDKNVTENISPIPPLLAQFHATENTDIILDRKMSILDIINKPPNAFPAPYDYSESTEVLSRFPIYDSSAWYRHPECCRRTKATHVDIEDLCSSFALSLNLRKRLREFVGSEKVPRWSPPTYDYLIPGRSLAFIGSPIALPSRRLQRASRVRTIKPLPRRLRESAFLKYNQSSLDFLPLSPCVSLSSTSRTRKLSVSSADSPPCTTPTSSPRLVSAQLPSITDPLFSVQHRVQSDHVLPVLKKQRRCTSRSPQYVI